MPDALQRHLSWCTVLLAASLALSLLNLAAACRLSEQVSRIAASLSEVVRSSESIP